MMMKNEIDKYLIQYKELFSSELFINSIPDEETTFSLTFPLVDVK